MSKKFESRIQHLKDQENERKKHSHHNDHDRDKKDPKIDTATYKKFSSKKEKDNLKNIMKKMEKSKRIW